MWEVLRDWMSRPPVLAERDMHYATDYGRDILQNSPDGWEHDQQHLWWVDGPGAGTPNGYGNPPPDARGAGGLSGAAALPAIVRCTAIICDTIAGLPWRVYRGYNQQETPRWITDPQLLRDDGRVRRGPMVADPLSSVEFYTQWIASALWFGDGFIFSSEIDEDGWLRPPLTLLDPQMIEIRKSEHRTVRLDGEEIPLKTYWHEKLGELPSSHVVRLRGEPPYQNGRMGTGIIDRFAGDIALANAMRAYASNIFATGVPSGYLKVHAPQVSEAQAETLQTRWMGRHGGPRRKVAVLNSSTDFVPVSISPVDSQLDAARVWSLRDIALACGVPAYMLGVPGDSSTYANVESRMTELRTFTLLPWIRRIEAALDSQFAAGTEVKISTDGTLRADTSTRYAAYETALRSGFLTVDEVRALEDRPPLPEQVSTDPADDMPAVVPSDEQPAPATIPEPAPATPAELEPAEIGT